MVKNKQQMMFLNLIILQMFLSCFISWSFLNFRSLGWKPSIIIIFAVTVLIGVLCIWTVKEILRLVKIQHEAEIADTRLEESKALNRALKVKQHDFANHLQVISGLVYLGETKKVKEYIKNICADLMIIERLTGLKSPELAALISKKMTMSDTVKLDLEIQTDLRHLHVPGDKMVSILGNLLDNAIHEQENHLLSNSVSLKIKEDGEKYVFVVSNAGFIPRHLQSKIFEPGVTTKGEKGSGMGLHIVKKLVGRYAGSVNFVSDADSGTTFVVEFPIQLEPENVKPKKELISAKEGERTYDGNF